MDKSKSTIFLADPFTHHVDCCGFVVSRLYRSRAFNAAVLPPDRHPETFTGVYRNTNLARRAVRDWWLMSLCHSLPQVSTQGLAICERGGECPRDARLPLLSFSHGRHFGREREWIYRCVRHACAYGSG